MLECSPKVKKALIHHVHPKRRRLLSVSEAQYCILPLGMLL